MGYTDQFKAAQVRRMTGSEAISATVLAREIGIAQPTLSRWVREASSVGGMKKKGDGKTRRQKAWTAAEKLRVLHATAGVDEEKLGELLRREGLHSSVLDRWRQEALKGLAGGTLGAPAEAQARIRELERELLRKEKALAETAALLVLRKKLEALHWYEDDAPSEPNESSSWPRSTKR
jgi:transposase